MKYATLKAHAVGLKDPPRWEVLGDGKGIPARTRISPDSTTAKTIPPPKRKGRGKAEGSSQSPNGHKKERKGRWDCQTTKKKGKGLNRVPRPNLQLILKEGREERRERPIERDRNLLPRAKVQREPVKGHPRFPRIGRISHTISG